MLLALILAVFVLLQYVATRYSKPATVIETERRETKVNRLYGRANALEPLVVFVAYAMLALFTAVGPYRGSLDEGLHFFLIVVWGAGAVSLAGTVVLGLLKARLHKFALIGLAWRALALALLWSTQGLTAALIAAGWELLYRLFNCYTKWAAWSVRQEKLAAAGVRHGE